MNRWLLAVYLVCAAPLLAEGKPAKEIVRDTFPSVVKILSTDAEGEVVLGSGFFVARNVVATNFHVVKNLRNGTIHVIGQKPQYPILRIIASDENHDIALLRVSEVKAAPLFLGDSQTVAVGDVVYAIGNPGGLEGTISNGIISGLRDGGILQTNAPISLGSSGGPLLNETGEVIGIILGFYITGQNLNFAMPAIELQQLMGRSGINYASRSSVVPPRNATVLPSHKAAPVSPPPRELPQAEPIPEPSLREEVTSMSANSRPIPPPQRAREAPATALERCPPKAQRYCPVLQAAINRMWNSDYNPAFRQVLESAGNSSALMLIEIRPDGTIQSIVLKESSGNRSYDLAVETLLRDQKRFPPLPEELSGENFQALLSFRR